MSGAPIGCQVRKPTPSVVILPSRFEAWLLMLRNSAPAGLPWPSTQTAISSGASLNSHSRQNHLALGICPPEPMYSGPLPCQYVICQLVLLPVYDASSRWWSESGKPFSVFDDVTNAVWPPLSVGKSVA